VRTYRDDAKGAERGENVCWVYELDGLHTVHLGDIGHLLTEEQVGEIGTVDVICVPVGGALTPARAGELVAQLDANLVVPLVLTDDEQTGAAELGRFLHEMGASETTPQPRLSVSTASIPAESTVVLLESKGKS
jgi:L-ascorbate metabolism protein UlaG (beta-lactamase superfamily)